MHKENTLACIDQNISAINDFVELDQNHYVINLTEKSQFRVAVENMKNLRRKLASDELEVAVVGLEKAGKSMFSSAFVGEPGLFPSADERCTFTSTRLQYGEENHAIVEFYSKAEFCEKFEKMLEEVEFHNGNLETIRQDTFDDHFESLKHTNRHIYNTHSSKTETDIKDIIEGRAKILNLLGKPNQKFGDFNSPELKLFITDKYLSRAVKDVAFFSSNLKGLENVILYDVPGFDSPTQVHIDQTIKKLQDVDAIIMVKSIKMPSLKGGEVDILVQNSDMDGIRLYEKLFVFGSYADAVASIEDLQNNKQTLLDGLSKSLKEKFSQNRLFTGCLDQKFEKNLNAMGSHTELKELKAELEKYNQNDRISILQKRINKAVEEVKGLCRIIIDRNQHEQGRADFAKMNSAFELKRNTVQELKDGLSKFINHENSLINQEAIFTKTLIENVAEIMPSANKCDVQRVADELAATNPRMHVDYEHLNIMLREEITLKVKDDFIGMVFDVSKKKSYEIKEGAVALFLKALGVNESHAKYRELKDKVSAYVYEQTDGRRFDTASFKPLVERFTIDLIETILKAPLGSDARKSRFEKGARELFMLSLFSPNADMSLPLYKNELVSLVLCQQKSLDEKSSVNKSNYIQPIISMFNQKGISIGVSESSLVTDFIEASFKHGATIEQLVDLIGKVSRFPSDPVKALAFVSEKVLEQLANAPVLGTQEIYIDSLLANVQRAKSEEDVIQEIEKDLENLVYLFKECVIKAISLELPFTSIITHFIAVLKSSLEKSAFDDFIIAIIQDVRYSEFAKYDDEASRSEIRKKIIGEMQRIATSFG